MEEELFLSEAQQSKGGVGTVTGENGPRRTRDGALGLGATTCSPRPGEFTVVACPCVKAAQFHETDERKGGEIFTGRFPTKYTPRPASMISSVCERLTAR